MNAVQELVLRKLREGGIVSDAMGDSPMEVNSESGTKDSTDQWVMAISLAEYDPSVHYVPDEDDVYDEDEYTVSDTMSLVPTHVCRVVYRTEWYPSAYGENMLSLVDGDDLFLIIEGDTVRSIWESLWEGSQPSYYGGPIGPAYDWVAELGEVFYTQVGNPFKGDRDADITIDSERAKWDEHERARRERYNQGCDICGSNKGGLIMYGDGRQFCHKHQPKDE